MTKYLLDTNAVNQLMNPKPIFQNRVRQARIRGDRIGTCEPVIAELFFGLEFSSSKDENLVRLRRALSEIRSWPFNREAAREYGRIAAELRRLGRPMQAVDKMIAAIAMSLGNTIVVTTDTDLLAIPGLKVENWAAAPGTP